MTRSKLLRRLAAVAPPIVAEFTKPGPHCVLSSAVGVMVLERFGVSAAPYAAEVRVCNAAWMAWAQTDFAGGRDEQLARGAHIITNQPAFDGENLPSLNPPTGPAWPGHLAIRVDDVLIDLDFGAFNRPTKGIIVPPACIAPIGADGTVTGEYRCGRDVTYIRYAPLVAPYAEDFRTSKDWTERDRFEEHVAVIVKQIR